MKKVFSPLEVANLLGVNRMTIYREIDRGNLGSVKVGGQQKITIAHLEEYLSRDGQDGKALVRSLLENGNGN
jgi:excisionase family DNA binding protein